MIRARTAATLLFLSLMAMGALNHFSLPVEEAVRAEAEARAMALARLSDPTRAPAIRDCPGQQFIAWRDAGQAWKHACVDVHLNPKESPL